MILIMFLVVNLRQLLVFEEVAVFTLSIWAFKWKKFMQR